MNAKQFPSKPPGLQVHCTLASHSSSQNPGALPASTMAASCMHLTARPGPSHEPHREPLTGLGDTAPALHCSDDCRFVSAVVAAIRLSQPTPLQAPASRLSHLLPAGPCAPTTPCTTQRCVGGDRLLCMTPPPTSSARQVWKAAEQKQQIEAVDSRATWRRRSMRALRHVPQLYGST
jgi:hypothetical protein